MYLLSAEYDAGNGFSLVSAIQEGFSKNRVGEHKIEISAKLWFLSELKLFKLILLELYGFGSEHGRFLRVSLV